MNVQQLLTFAEWASVILTVLLGIARIGLGVWKYMDHGHPDARRDWISEAVNLAVLARGEMDSLLKVGAGTPIDQAVAKDIAGRAQQYLHDHGLTGIHLNEDTVRMVLNKLRDLESGVGFTHPK